MITGLFAIVVGWKLKGPAVPSLDKLDGNVGETGLTSNANSRPEEGPFCKTRGESEVGSCGISPASIRTGESSGGGVGVRGGCGIGSLEAMMKLQGSL